MKITPTNETSPTDQMKPIYTDGDCPAGYDICGRRILHRDGRPGFPLNVRERERDIFYQCRLRYTQRTGLKPFVDVWSFNESDIWPCLDRVRELNRMQGFISLQ